MTRPAAPSWTIPVWAPNTNYPASADPWSLTPCKVTHPGAASVGITPKTGVAAQVINKLINEAYAADTDAKTFATTLHTWLIDRFGLVDLRNWFAPQTSVTGPCHIKYKGAIRKHYVGGVDGSSKATFARTMDPSVWSTTNEVVGNTFGVFDGSFDVATDGSVVIPGSGATDGAKVLECTAAGVWTVRAAVFTNALVAPDCVFDPVSGNWVVFGKRNGSLTADVWTSTNRTAWTSRTPPASIPTDGVGGPYVRLATDGLGKIVAQFFPSSVPGDSTTNSISFSCSSDGGVTWSAVNTKTTAFSASAGSDIHSSPIWNGSKWVATASYQNGDGATVKTYVYNSTDGSTWTQVALLTTVAIHSIASSIDGIVIGTTYNGQYVYSTDDGATWYPLGIGMASGVQVRVHAANGGLVITDFSGNKVHHSAVLGTGPGTALT